MCVACFAILWLALKGEGVFSPVADSLDAAAVDKSGALFFRVVPGVSRLTYQTVIDVLTPEGWRYERYVSTQAILQGGFLSVLWDVPKKPTCMRLVTLVPWLSGCRIRSPLDNLAVLQKAGYFSKCCLVC